MNKTITSASDEETITDAINRSVRHNEIAHLRAGGDFDEDFDPRAALLDLCDDHADNGEIIEFWGTDSDGDEWRVHLNVSE